MDLRDLKRLAACGEGPHVEFKRRVPRPERLAKEAIALANTQGGRLLIGVNDDGEVCGVRDAEEEAFALEHAMRRHCDPPIAYGVTRVSVTGRREVLVVDIPASARRPHYLVGAEDDPNARTAYVRVGDQSVEASREAVRLMRFAAEPRDVHFEFGDKERVLMAYLDRHERVTVEQFARLAGIPRKRASQTLVLLTKANLLRLHPDAGDDYFTLSYNTAA